MKPIFLIGFMAGGKTTLGRALAAAVPGVAFIDLDDAVEAEAGCPVAEIFAHEGESTFRRLESEVLRRVAADNTVVACGGGTPCRPENMDFMLGRGTVIRLDASVDVIIRRLGEARRGQRPLVDALLDRPDALRAYIEDLMASRECYYARAPHRFNADRLDTPGQIAESVEKFKLQFLNTASK